MNGRIVTFALSAVLAGTAGADVASRDLGATDPILRAVFHVSDVVAPSAAKGVVVLFPGCNGDGRAMIDGEDELTAAWRDFAKASGYLLCSFTFESKIELLEHRGGYYDAASGSGERVSRALAEAGVRDKPTFLFGFSGGAHLVSSIAEGRFVHNLSGWCAHAFGGNRLCDRIRREASAKAMPPGIVACGLLDRRLGDVNGYFIRGRSYGRRWTLAEVADLGHERSMKLENFVRSWFAKVPKGHGAYVGLGASDDDFQNEGEAFRDAFRCWLPDKSLEDEWRGLAPRRRNPIAAYGAPLSGLGDRERLTVMMLKDERLFGKGATNRVRGAVCLCMLADTPVAVAECLRKREGASGEFYRFAEENDLAVFAIGSIGGLWEAGVNWEDLDDAHRKKIRNNFNSVAKAFEKGIVSLSKRYGIPSGKLMMTGFCGSAQFTERLALQRPGMFLAVHIDIPGSFGRAEARSNRLLWCVTTGQRLAGGYENSLAFFRDARDLYYPIVYKAYPQVSHSDKTARSDELAVACFRYALKLSEAQPGPIDWADAFASATNVADIRNNRVRTIDDYADILPEHRMMLPEEILSAWIAR